MLCPNCRNVLDRNPRLCPLCGTDLRIAKKLLDDYSDQLAKGVDALKRGGLASAVTSLKDAINLVAGIPDAHFFYGTTLGLSGRFDEAMEEFKKVPEDHKLGQEARYIIAQMTMLTELHTELALPDEKDKKRAAKNLEKLKSSYGKLSHLEEELALKMLSSQDSRFAHLSPVADRLASFRMDGASNDD